MKKLIFVIMFLFYCPLLLASELNDYRDIKCIIHLHTSISKGAKTLESYIEEAKEYGISSIILTDTDWQRWEYGLPPFRRWIKKVVQEKSVMTFGIEKYLELIKELNEKYKDIVVIDGVQTGPFYYWSGNFLKGALALNNRNKDMLVVGLGNADSYTNMPLLANNKSRFDAYHGDKFTLPYQDLIDYVVKREGLIFWSHPEYEENILQYGIRLITVPYHGDLVGTHNYAGFGVFWDGYTKIGKPKGIWDRILTEYCQGRRKKPIWAIGELEEEGRGDKNLDDIVNVLYIKELNRRQILDALNKGRFYVTFKVLDRIPLSLNEFVVSDASGDKSATMGEEVSFSSDPSIKISISYEKPLDKDITVKLIRNNEIIEEFSNNRELEITYKDEGLVRNQKYYYRIDAISNIGSHLISNPIFFSKE